MESPGSGVDQTVVRDSTASSSSKQYSYVVAFAFRVFRRHTTEPSTDLRGIPWNPNPNPNPRCRGHWSAVGVAMTVAMECRGGCRGGCHGTTHRMPRHPPRCHGILGHAMGYRGDAMVCHGWYHGHAKKKSKSVEPCR